MYLLEFTDESRLINILAAIESIKQGIDDGEIVNNWTMDELIEYFRKYNINMSPKTIYSMSEKKPLKSIIHPIKGKEIRFKGLPQEPAKPESLPPEASKSVVSKMAKHALSK